MRKGLIGDVKECFDEARDLVGGTQHPDRMAAKHDLIDAIEKELRAELRALEAIERTAIEMFEVCPADSDATDKYWQATSAFKDALERAQRARQVAWKRTQAATEAFTTTKAFIEE